MIYIAGPMTGLPDYNRPAFYEAAKSWEEQGYAVLNPAVPDKSLDDSDWVGYMRRSLQNLLVCDKVVFLPGWELSRGARLEHQIAQALEMEIYYE